MKKLIAWGVTVTASLMAFAVPAAADPWSGGGDISDDGVIAEARRQMNELNTGYPGGPPPPNCNDEHEFVPEDGNDIVEYEGYLRWVPDFGNDPTPPDGVSNEWYRRECYIPGLPPRTGEPPGALWQRFDAVDPENIARVAMDNMLAAIPDHTIDTNPDVVGMVAFDIWFWVNGGAVAPVEVSAGVPGTQVVATAEPGGVHFTLGDGATLECEDFGTPWQEGATSTCTHAYQAAGTYEVTASILWTGSYTINGGAPIPIETGVERTATFTLPVNEAQAVNTGSGG